MGASGGLSPTKTNHRIKGWNSGASQRPRRDRDESALSSKTTVKSIAPS